MRSAARCASRRPSRARRSGRCSTCSSTSWSAVVHAARARLPRLHPGRRPVSRGAGRLHRQRRQPLHRRVAGRAGAGAARGQRPRLAARLDGLPGRARAGCFTSGGSMANFNAIVCARERHSAATSARRALHVGARRTTASPSRRSSPASCPIASARVPVDAQFRLRIDALARGDRRRSARGPAAVPRRRPPPGTTNTGAVDPLDAVADLCAARGPVAPRRWRLRRLLPRWCRSCARCCAGLSRADSLDARSAQGAVPALRHRARCSCATAQALRAAHDAPPPTTCRRARPEEFYDPSQHGPELSRGFRGLRVWLP